MQSSSETVFSVGVEVHTGELMCVNAQSEEFLKIRSPSISYFLSFNSFSSTRN